MTAISPSVGSTSGDTPVVITGIGFRPGAIATFDGVRVAARFDGRYSNRIYVDTPPHAAGTVDVLVTNIDSQPGRLEAGYTYVVPESLDFNGTWSGYPWDGSDLLVEFTIENDQLLSVSCDTTTVTFSPPVPVTNGAFAFSRDGSSMTGKIVSHTLAVGDIALAPCHAPFWEAERKR